MSLVTLSCCGIRSCKRSPEIVSGIRKMQVESAFCLRIPHTFFGFRTHFAESTYSCGIQKQLAIFSCCGIRNERNVPTKFTLQVFVRGIQETFVRGILIHFGTCLYLDSRNIQTQNCAPIQCTVWPRNVRQFFFKKTRILN